MKTNEVAKLTGITVRTLQYYDKIGLLQPTKNPNNQYRDYDKNDIDTLQQILFFRELDFPLAQIKEIITNPSYDKNDALEHQKELLILKRNRLNRIIELVNKSIKGDDTMNFEAFNEDDIQKQKDSYAKEVQERWGKTDAYAEYAQKSKKYSKEEWNQINALSNEIMKGFAEIRHLSPESPEAQEQVKVWQDHISQYYYNCTLPILSSLGAMYVGDERFRNNIDQFGEGTASFMAKAIEVYCEDM